MRQVVIVVMVYSLVDITQLLFTARGGNTSLIKLKLKTNYTLSREGFKKKINFFRGIFREGGGGGDPPAAKIINFFSDKKRVANGLKWSKT